MVTAGTVVGETVVAGAVVGETVVGGTVVAGTVVGGAVVAGMVTAGGSAPPPAGSTATTPSVVMTARNRVTTFRPRHPAIVVTLARWFLL